MPQGSNTSAVSHFLGPWWTALLQSSGSNHRPVDRALGAAATLGLSIVILRLVAQAFKAARHEGEGSSSTLRIVQGIIRGLFATGSEKHEAVDTKKVLHKGSCHCRAVAFEVREEKLL